MVVVEQWKLIKNYENYEVSSMGRVRRNGNILKFDIANEYFRVSLYKNGNRKHKYVHRLVLETFKLNPNPLKLTICDHINRIKKDNRLSNLRWSSFTENSYNRNTRGYYYDRDRKKFISHIIFDGKRKYLGAFKYSQLARRAYISAKEKYHVYSV